MMEDKDNNSIQSYTDALEKGKDIGLGELHKEIVDKVCKFLKDKGVANVESFSIIADGLGWSVKFGYWTPATDSSMTIEDKNKGLIAISI